MNELNSATDINAYLVEDQPSCEELVEDNQQEIEEFVHEIHDDSLDIYDGEEIAYFAEESDTDGGAAAIENPWRQFF